MHVGCNAPRSLHLPDRSEEKRKRCGEVRRFESSHCLTDSRVIAFDPHRQDGDVPEAGDKELEEHPRSVQHALRSVVAVEWERRCEPRGRSSAVKRL